MSNPLRHKFRNIPTIQGGRRYASKKEAKRGWELDQAQKSGDLLFYLWQVPFHVRSGARYVVDFACFWKDGTVTFEDVKGFKTAVYKLKKRTVENEYPVEIVEL